MLESGIVQYADVPRSEGTRFSKPLCSEQSVQSMIFRMLLRFPSRFLILATVLLTVAAVPVYAFSGSDEPSSIVIEKVIEDVEDDDDRESLVVLFSESAIERILHASSFREISPFSDLPAVRRLHNERGPPVV